MPAVPGREVVRMPAVPGREVVRTSGGVTTRLEPVRVRRFQWHAPPCVRRRRDQTVRPPVRTASPRGGELGEGGFVTGANHPTTN